ncbi:MAG: AEC family transporter [Rubrivivax sp.]|jgi:predicted permease|nr:AEC family transporter [Betaproteobacteria bacterium]MBP6318073.1 AEC family transporter [Rubrivivax sp.]MBK7277976.1 AEC family transporter [Betaproteobacteria bacterium]MBK7457092.1 AEC family transporter [Betaproteobacteria bacterium]MBK7518190.1 AEC family transporter [Betaproteobacteria bacterium]
MSDALLLLPDFALIVLGWLICRHTPLNRPVWDGAERLVYYVLFPALLFNAILRYPLAPGSALPLAAGGLAVVLVGVAAAYALQAWPGVDTRLHASGAQTAFRFNSYVALAMAERLEGTPGVAWMALIMSVCIPLCNVAAVWPLARHGGQGYLRELARNPLILATVSGLLCNLLGVRLPALADVTLARMGAAALPLGLMAVGAGLQFGALREGPRLAAALMSIRHALMPAAALALILATTLPRGQQAVLMAFAAMPTASSAYVLAARMGGNGPYTAGLVTLSTLIGMVALPAWLVLWRALSG